MNADAPQHRLADHPVAPMFVERHSPRSFTELPVTEAEVMILLEAARWAPSSSNLQPWRFAWGLRGDAGFELIAAALVPFNRDWAQKAGALVVIASKSVVERDGASHPNAAHAFDAGSAWMSLALQAHAMGLAAHAMGGFDKDQAARTLALPADHVLHAVVAVGHQGAPELLPEALRPREVPSLRVPLAQLAGHGRFV